MPSSLPLAANETAAIALDCPRTAALCFDRIWSVDDECPDEIRFIGRSDAELIANFLNGMRTSFNHEKSSDPDMEILVDAFLEKGSPDNFYDDLTEGAKEILAFIYLALSLTKDEREIKTGSLSHFTRTISEEVSQALGRAVTPVFRSERVRDAEYTFGDREVIVAALREFEVVDEESLAWQQVLEFRRDSEARADYRRLVHWLDAAMVGRPKNFVIDEIGMRVERYRQAVRKHGLKSRLGVLASLVDAKALVGAAAAASGALIAGESLWGLLAASSFLFGKALLTVGQAKIDLDEIHEAHSEIAFVAEVNERLTSIGSSEE